MISFHAYFWNLVLAGMSIGVSNSSGNISFIRSSLNLTNLFKIIIKWEKKTQNEKIVLHTNKPQFITHQNKNIWFSTAQFEWQISNFIKKGEKWISNF